MGNKTSPSDKDNVEMQKTRAAQAGSHAGSASGAESSEEESWTFQLKNPTGKASGLEQGSPVRAVEATPLFEVRSGELLVGYVPESDSQSMRRANQRDPGVFQGQVVRIEPTSSSNRYRIKIWKVG